VHQVDPPTDFQRTVDTSDTHTHTNTHTNTHTLTHTFFLCVVYTTDYERALDTSEEAVVGLLHAQLLCSPFAESEVLGTPWKSRRSQKQKFLVLLCSRSQSSVAFVL